MSRSKILKIWKSSKNSIEIHLTPFFLPPSSLKKREKGGKKNSIYEIPRLRNSTENFSTFFFEEKGKEREGGGAGGTKRFGGGIGTKQFCQGASRRNATEPDRGKWSRGGGGGGREGGIIASGYRVLLPYVPCMRVTAFRSNRFPHPSPSPSLLLSLVRPVKINKGTINKNYTFFIHLAREGGWGLAWGSNQRSWLYTLLVHLPPSSSTRAQPPSISPFFGKRKRKRRGGEGVRKKFSLIDRWTRTVFEEEDSRDVD